MNDAEFIDNVKKQLNKLHEDRLKTENEVKIALVFMKNFKPTLRQLVNENKEKDEFFFGKRQIIKEECEIDMRTYMDDELIAEIIGMGFVYEYTMSNVDILYFKSIKNNDNK